MLANGRFSAFMKWRRTKVAAYRAGVLEGLRHLRRDDVRERAHRLGAALRQERGVEEVADALLAT